MTSSKLSTNLMAKDGIIEPSNCTSSEGRGEIMYLDYLEPPIPSLTYLRRSTPGLDNFG